MLARAIGCTQPLFSGLTSVQPDAYDCLAAAPRVGPPKSTRVRRCMVRSDSSSISHTSAVAPVVPTSKAGSRLRPLGLARARIESGLWSDRRQTNRDLSIPHGAAMLEASGNLVNFHLALGESGNYRGDDHDGGSTAPFLDSDVYKWLEAVGWELAQGDAPELRSLAEPMIELVARTQAADGYIDTFYQVAKPGLEFTDMEWGHELYVAGHLVQAAIAWTGCSESRRASSRGSKLKSGRANERLSADIPSSRWLSLSCTGSAAKRIILSSHGLWWIGEAAVCWGSPATALATGRTTRPCELPPNPRVMPSGRCIWIAAW